MPSPALVLCILSFTAASTMVAPTRAWADAGMTAAAIGAATRHLTLREYWASATERGLQAPNRRQNLRTYFGPHGVRVVDRTAPGAPELLSLALEGFGRESGVAPVPPASVHHERERVELRRPGLVEWYVNRAEGLEQGFTLEARPEGEGRLVLALRLEGAQATRRGAALGLQSAAGRTLAYGKLAAFDANGDALPVELAATAPGRIELRVDDAGAAYPVLVDPLLSGTDDGTLTSAQTFALLGTSVASAGDVNGDGFADVIAAAYSFDAGEVNEGAAFVFHGGPFGVGVGTTLTADTQLETDQQSASVTSVAGAGDVNGDGYADVIIGSEGYGAGQTDEGAAFVFLGGPGGIPDGDPGSAHAVLEGNATDVSFGASVASAGDVNGDGYADVVVGAPGWGFLSLEGAAFVFHGSASGIASAGALQADAQIIEPALSALGVSVASAGDVNGDGYADIVLGDRLYSASFSAEGGTFVYHGSASGITSGGLAQADTVLEGGIPNCRFGDAVASAGDVNGDGYSDVIAGGDECTIAVTDEGAAFVFLGGPGGIPDATAPTASATLRGNQSFSRMGSALAGPGDVNGDGYTDVVVGAYQYDSPELAEGAAFVFLGGSGGIADGDPSSAYAHLQVNEAIAFAGVSVAGGDVNGDGMADVFVGAQYYGPSDEGAVFVYHGGGDGLVDASALDADTLLEADQVDTELGVSVASAGDVNGDGYADVIVGARSFDAGQADEGAAFVFLGSAAGIADASPATAHAQLESDQPGGGMGGSVAGAGDVNGDGYEDVIVGTDGYDNGQTDEGVAFVYHGSASGIASGNPSTADATLETNQANAAVGNGTFVASAGDVNADGYADVIIGAPFWDESGQNDRGIALVFVGGAGGVGDGGPTEAWDQFQGGASSDRLGSSVASAGDVNGDGFADVIIGIKLDDTAFGTNTGSATIRLGGPFALTIGGLLSGTDPGSGFGDSVASAGDVNGDGYADVIVGANTHDVGSGNEGAAFVFLGSATGVGNGDADNAHASLLGGQLDAFFGRSVASAGDVNSDGYADVIVGAPGYDNGQTDEGAAFVYLGSAGGITGGDPSVAHAWIEGDEPDAELGRSVASAGDVDGNGLADVIVGAPFLDAGHSDEGAALVFHPSGGANRPGAAQQLDPTDGSLVPQSGVSGQGTFTATLRATHPMGRGLVKAEVEWCPPGSAFGDAACGRQISADWTDTGATPDGVTLVEALPQLVSDTLYRWRARVLHAPVGADAPGITPPTNPPHGPWRRPSAQAREGDVRPVPEPGLALGLLAGCGLLARLQRGRRQR